MVREYLCLHPLRQKVVSKSRERKKTDHIRDGHDVKDVQDGHQKVGKRTQGGSQDHCLLEAFKALMSGGPKRLRMDQSEKRSHKAFMKWDH